jgi:hypothetical protein
MMPIKEFVHEYLTSDHVQKIQAGHGPDAVGWNDILESGGYISVVFSNTVWALTREVAQWCREKFGADHYYWTGGAFWFESEEHVAMFMLRWK